MNWIKVYDSFDTRQEFKIQWKTFEDVHANLVFVVQNCDSCWIMGILFMWMSKNLEDSYNQHLLDLTLFLMFDDSCYYLSFLCWVLFIYVIQYFLGWVLTKLTSSHHLQEYYSLFRSIYGSRGKWIVFKLLSFMRSCHHNRK